MKQLVVICTAIVTAASIVAGCANYAYGPKPQPKPHKPRHHISAKAAEIVHPKAEPTPDFQTYGGTYQVNPDGSWHWIADPTPAPDPKPTSTPRQQSF